MISLVFCSNCSSGARNGEAGPASYATLEITRGDYFDERVDLFDASPIVVALGVVKEDSRAFALSTMLRMEGLTERCMAESGFLYYPHVVSDDLGDTWLPAMSRIEFARAHGFGSALQPDDKLYDALAEDDPNESHVLGMDETDREAWERALFDSDGCRARAEKSIWGEQTAALVALQEEAAREVGSHVDVRRAAEEYLACTRDAGYPWLNNPWISRLIGVQVDLSPQEERAAALADLECLYPAELVRRSVRHSVEYRLVEDNAELLASLRREIAAR